MCDKCREPAKRFVGTTCIECHLVDKVMRLETDLSQAQKPQAEFTRIADLIRWAHDNGALHIKTPYIEMVFPPKGTDSVMESNAPNSVVYKNPLDDPDMYVAAQDKFYSAKVTP